MKKNILVFVMLLIFSGTLVFQSCNEEPVAFEEYGAFTIPELVAPANGTFLSPAGTTVELKWLSTDAEGDPQTWDVYFGPSEDPAKVKTGHTSQSYTVTVDLGTKYYWKVVGTDAKGIPTRSEIWSFEIVDPDALLTVKMDWSTNILDAIGVDVKPADAVDLRLLILDEDFNVVDIVDGSAFEEYEFDSALPDGLYYIAADIYSTVDAGDLNEVLDIDIKLVFNQRGILYQTFSFPTVMTNENACDLYSARLVKVTKTGDAYTVVQEVVQVTPPVLTWKGTDATYPSEVTSTETCSDMTLSMLVNGWMLDWWGEIIIKGGMAVYTVDGSGNVTIPFQYYCTTTYNGAVQPNYSIQGSGTIDNSGTYPVMTLHYDIKQGSTWIGHYCFVNYGWEQDGFDAVITTDPSGKGSKGVSPMRPPKPIR